MNRSDVRLSSLDFSIPLTVHRCSLRFLCGIATFLHIREKKKRALPCSSSTTTRWTWFTYSARKRWDCCSWRWAITDRWRPFLWLAWIRGQVLPGHEHSAWASSSAVKGSPNKNKDKSTSASTSTSQLLSWDHDGGRLDREMAYEATSKSKVSRTAVSITCVLSLAWAATGCIGSGSTTARPSVEEGHCGGLCAGCYPVWTAPVWKGENHAAGRVLAPFRQV